MAKLDLVAKPSIDRECLGINSANKQLNRQTAFAVYLR